MRFIHRANVYIETVATGVYDVLHKEALRCRSTHLGAGVPFDQRRDAGEMRHLQFDRDYVMPTDCRIEIAGTRYSPIEETFKTIIGPNGQIKMRAVDILEYETES
jgi:hypothetical protein